MISFHVMIIKIGDSGVASSVLLLSRNNTH